MILLDTNIVISLQNNQLNDKAIDALRNTSLHTCNIIIAEVLGYRLIKEADSKYFADLFSVMKNHLFDNEVTAKVIELRRTMNIKLPDAIIAATALVNGLTLWTHNTEDFKSVRGLQLFDPLEA